MDQFGAITATSPRDYTPEEAKAFLSLPAAAPLIIPQVWSRTPFNGYSYAFGHKITTTIGDVPDIAAQEAAPTKPADKAQSFSTYGVVIPISLGKRRMGGNVVQSTAITSVMIGTYDYEVTYQVPITTTDDTFGKNTVIPGPDSDMSDELFDLTETDNTTTTERIFQDNDDTSDNWVDVERYHTITLTDAGGHTRTFTFQVS